MLGQGKALCGAMFSLALFCVGDAHGRTWYVERDGSGDFVVIQDAVDAASDGDIIMIGPGRFDEYQTAGPIAYDVYVLIRNKSLTFIGAGPEATIIGPADANHHPWPGRDVMIFKTFNFTSLVLRGLCLEHSPWKLVSCAVGSGRLEVENCIFREGGMGISGFFAGGGWVRNCAFRDLTDEGVAVYDPTPNFEVSACTFQNVYKPVGVYWSPTRCDVFDCTMNGGRTGVGFSDLAAGSVVGCEIRNFQNYGITCNDCGEQLVTDNIIEQTTGWGMALAGAHDTVIRQNVISTESGKCLYLSRPSDGMVFEQNHLLRGNGDYALTNS